MMGMRFVNWTTGFVVALLLSACAGIGGLPSPDALIQRHIDVAYQGKGLDAKTSMTMEGRLIMADYDVEEPFVMKVEAPDKRSFKTTVTGVDVARVCKAGTCWAQEIDAPMERVGGGQLDFMAETADFYRLENLHRYYRRLETAQLTQFGGEAAYELQLVRNNGYRDKWYFSKDSGLWLGGVWKLPREMGGAQVTQRFASYEEFGGIQLATEIVETAPTESTITIESVTFEDIPDSDFDVGR